MFGSDNKKNPTPAKKEELDLLNKKNKEQEEKIAKEIVVHKMPRGYKAGTFSYDDYFNHKNEGGAPSSSGGIMQPPRHASHKTGVFIMIFGVLLIGGIAFGMYSYLKNPEKFTLFSGGSKQEGEQKEENLPLVNIPDKITEEEEAPLIPTSTETSLSTTTENTSVPVSSTPEIIISPLEGISDLDNDGLSAEEEIALGTDSALTDSDGDNYNDLTEALNGYNPAGTGKMGENNKVAKYTNSAYKYTLLYPTVFTAEDIDNKATVIFTAPDDSFIQVVAQANSKKEDIKTWYQEEFAIYLENKDLVSGNSWTGVKSPDGLILYATDEARRYIYIISYTPLNEKSLTYRNLLEVMIKSLEILK